MSRGEEELDEGGLVLEELQAELADARTRQTVRQFLAREDLAEVARRLEAARDGARAQASRCEVELAALQLREAGRVAAASAGATPAVVASVGTIAEGVGALLTCCGYATAGAVVGAVGAGIVGRPAPSPPPPTKHAELDRLQELLRARYELALSAGSAWEERRLLATFDAAVASSHRPRALLELPGPAVKLNPTPEELARLSMPVGPPIPHSPPRPRLWLRSWRRVQRAGAVAARLAGDVFAFVGDLGG